MQPFLLLLKNVMSHIIIVIIVGAIAGWLAGMIVDSDSQSFLLDVVIGIVGGYISYNYIFHHHVPTISGYYWVDITLISTVGAVILALIIKLIRRMARR